MGIIDKNEIKCSLVPLVLALTKSAAADVQLPSLVQPEDAQDELNKQKHSTILNRY